MTSFSHWRCRACQEILGEVRNGTLLPRASVERIAPDGVVALLCTRCGVARLWKPRAQAAAITPQLRRVTERGHEKETKKYQREGDQARRDEVTAEGSAIDHLPGIDAETYLGHLRTSHAQGIETADAQGSRRWPPDLALVGWPDPLCEICVAVRERNRQLLIAWVRPYPHLDYDRSESEGDKVRARNDGLPWSVRVDTHLDGS
jgi:hypothetical protein